MLVKRRSLCPGHLSHFIADTITLAAQQARVTELQGKKEVNEMTRKRRGGSAKNRKSKGREVGRKKVGETNNRPYIGLSG